MRRLRVALEQPVVYFIALGVAVFVVDTWLRRANDLVKVTPTVRSEVVAELERTWGRAPTPDEVEQGVHDWVETELLFREAAELELQENDGVVRAHLASKLRHLVRQRTFVPPPSEDELRSELEANGARYTRPDTYSITHVFLRSGAPEGDDARVAEASRQLAAGADPSTVGDHFPRGSRFTELPGAVLDQVVGVRLSKSLTPERLQQWQTFRSSRGTHLVRLDAIVSGAPNLEKLRPELTTAIEEKKKDAAVQTFVDELRQKYDVRATPIP